MPAVGTLSWVNDAITHGYIPTYQGAGTDTPHYADDLAVPFHTPVGAPWSGKVLTAFYSTSFGSEVQIQLSTGSIYMILHMDILYCSAGGTVQQGDVLGLSGGENIYQVNQYPGSAHPCSPSQSSGPHVHVQWFTNWVSTPNGTIGYGPDITPALQALRSGNYGNPGNPGGGITGGGAGITLGSTAGTTVQGPPVLNKLAPNADLTVVLQLFDAACTIVNPFTAASAAAQQDRIGITNPITGQPIGPGITFSDPMSWLTDFGTAVILDFTGLMLRAILIGLGVFLIFKVVSNFIDFGKYASEGAGILATLAPLVAA